MPFKTEKLQLNDPFLDRRCKLIPCKKEMVLYWHEQGMSIRKIAQLFQVSKRLIGFTIYPERKEIDLKRRAERGGSMIYYKGGDKWNQTMREHRKYKYEILKPTVT